MSVRETVRYRNLGGVLKKIELRFGNELNLPGAILPSRLVTDPAGIKMIQKWVPAEVGKRDGCSYDLLDAEIRAGTRLGQVWGDTGHFPPAIGYNVDVAEPFVLLAPYRGVPLAVRRLELDELREFAISLLRALQQIAEAGVVHAAVRIASLRWDSQTQFLQLVDFEHALGHGDPRRPLNTIPGLPWEQAEGVGQADVRDDIWGAGMVIRQLAVGPYANGAEALPVQVQTLLQGVFAETAAARPHATELLARLGKGGSLSRALSPDTALGPGHQLFDQITARKYRTGLPQDGPEAPGNPASLLKGSHRLLLVLVAWVSLLLVLALLVLAVLR